MLSISVILPCYNAENLVRDAIQSILKQTTNNWELIVVDDASTDSSLSVIRSYQDDRIRVLSLDVNSGYPTAMNAGIALARGKYIARMDADDVCLPTRLEEQLKALELHPEAAFCGLNRYRITPGNKLYCDRNLTNDKYKIETWEDLITNHRLFTDPSVMVEKEKVLSVGGYRAFQRSGMDVDLWLRLMERFGPCVTITTPLFGKRLEPGSLIFKPETALINQVPRVLAQQRKQSGFDAIERGEKIDLQVWLQEGLLTPTHAREKRSLLVGTAVACVSLLDWQGFSTYFYHAWHMSATFTDKVTMLMELGSKLIRRIRHNPYKQFSLSDVGL
ncbi:MAG: glycosyltransferase family 2 protein [Cyclobacteriaceae bacterium]|nr:glycosyltransferase family 2 protein [Cyclobacteriaceae bacterium]